MVSDKFKVAIGLPVYNGEKYIKEALNSILAQTFSDFELVISDNASTDSTGEICMEYASGDNRIRYIRQKENLGAPRNFNRVFQQSRGKYFKWASANDVCEPTLVEKCMAILDDRPDIILCYPKTKLIDKNSQVIREYEDNLNLQNDNAVDRFIRLLINMRLNNAQNGLIRSDILRKTGLEDTYRAADICLMAELSLLGKFYEWPEFLYHRRIDTEASTVGQSDEYLNKFYNPKSKRRGDFKCVRLDVGLISVVKRSELSFSQKRRLYFVLARRLFWSRREIWAEFCACIKRCFSRDK